MSSDLALLLEMGFEEELAKTALKKGGNLNQAIDYLQNPPKESESNPNPGEVDEEEEAGPQDQANSLKCDDCGRLLKSSVQAEAHAAKTGHQNFSESVQEIKPLSPEEKAKKLEQLHERMKAIKEAKRLQEIEDNKAKEKVIIF